MWRGSPADAAEQRRLRWFFLWWWRWKWWPMVARRSVGRQLSLLLLDWTGAGVASEGRLPVKIGLAAVIGACRWLLLQGLLAWLFLVWENCWPRERERVNCNCGGPVGTKGDNLSVVMLQLFYVMSSSSSSLFCYIFPQNHLFSLSCMGMKLRVVKCVLFGQKSSKWWFS